MSSLDSILPALNVELPAAGDGASAHSAPPEKAGESFDHLMSRALSSAPAEAKKTDAGPAGKSHCQPSQQNKAPEDSKIPGDSKPSGTKTGAKDSGDDDKNKGDVPKHSQATPEAKATCGNFQNPPASLPSQTPAQVTATALTVAAALMTPPALTMATAKSAAGETAVPAVSISRAKPGKPAVASSAVFSKTTVVQTVDGGKPKEKQAVEKTANIVPANSSRDSSAKPAAVSTEKMLQPLQAVAEEKPDSTGAKAAKAPEAATDGAMTPKNFAAPDLPAKPAAQPAAAEHGTAVAKQDMPMKNGQQMNEVAGSGEKVLPGGAVLAAPEKNLPVRSPVVAPVPARVEQGDAIYTSSASTVTASVSEAASHGDVVSVSAAVETRPQVVERTHEMVAVQAVRLQETGSDMLRVVIKPDAGTQLSLELRQRGDGVEAQVTLQHGDFSQLNQHWTDLQQRLELRGVKLSPLADGQAFANFGNSQNSFQRRPDQAADGDLFAGAFGGFSPAGRIIETPALPVSPRGWEGWA